MFGVGVNVRASESRDLRFSAEKLLQVIVCLMHPLNRLATINDILSLYQLRELVERQYVVDGCKSVERVHEAYNHLQEFFGAEAKVAGLTRADINTYAEHRIKAGRARATVNNELAQFRRGFKLAIETGLLSVMPVFMLPKARNARSGFF